MKKLMIYRCSVCGNIVEVIHVGGGTLVCCGKEMMLQKENTTDGASEKHVPVIEKTDAGILVKIGSVAHPMEQVHYIEWIEIIVDSTTYRKFLNPGEAPEAFFSVRGNSIEAREYCNLHGLWKSV